MSRLRSAVIVPVPEAAAAVDDWRERTCDAKPSTGVPPHVTLLAPFVVPAKITGDVIEELRDVLAVPAFPLELRELRRFPGTLYLVPEPAAPFARLTAALVRRFPGYPPYGDPSLDVIPHLTVAQGDDELLDRAAAELESALPLRAEIRETLLLEHDGTRWQILERFHLG